MWFSWLFWWIAALYLLFFLCVCVSWGFFLDTRFFSTNSTRISFWRRGATNHQVRCDVFPRWDQKIFRRIAIPKRNMFPGGCRYLYNTYFFWSPTFISMLGLLSLSVYISKNVLYNIYALYMVMDIYICMYGYACGCHVFIYYPKLPTGMSTPYIVLRKNAYGSKTSCQQSGGSKKKVGRFRHAAHTWQSSQARGTACVTKVCPKMCRSQTWPASH